MGRGSLKGYLQAPVRKDVYVQITAWITIVYGVLIALGGLMGYVKAKSVPSLIAGGLCGLILIACGFLMQSGQSSALPVALAVTVVLILNFGMKFMSSKGGMPGGIAVLSIVALVGMLLTSRAG
jgi:uncharacterized membrane protein (UPF0136 family)